MSDEMDRELIEGEPVMCESNAGAMAHELREIADFIEANPEIAAGRTLYETISAAEQAIDETQMIEHEANEGQ